MRFIGSLLIVIVLIFLMANVSAVFLGVGVVLLTISLENKTVPQTRYISYGLIIVGLTASVTYYFWLKERMVNIGEWSVTSPATFNGQYQRADGKVSLTLSGDTVVFNFPKGVTMHGLTNMEKQDDADGLTAVAHIKGMYNIGKPYEHRFSMHLLEDNLTLTSLEAGHVSFIFTRTGQ